MHASLLLLTTALSSASAALVSGYVGAACMGERLWEYDVPNFDNCIDVSTYTEANSIIIAEFNAGQVVQLFSDSDCSTQIYDHDTDICYTVPREEVKSIKVAKVLAIG